MVILDLVGVVMSQHWSIGAQHVGRWTIIPATPQKKAVEENSVTEEQPEVIETPRRLEVICACENGLLGPWEAKKCA